MHKNKTARTVTARGGQANIFVTHPGNKIPDPFLLQAGNMDVGIRIVGGCAGMTPDMKARLLDYFVQGFADIDNAVLMSGGTRHLNEDETLDAMVTDTPGAIVDAYPDRNLVTLATTPKAGQLALIRESRFGLADTYGGFNDMNPTFDANLIVQPDAITESDWDGDLATYGTIMRLWEGAGIRVGMVVLNGGGVTAKEIAMALENEWPLVLIDDGITDRQSAKWAQKFRVEGTPDNVFIAEFNDPLTLREGLKKFGFIE